MAAPLVLMGDTCNRIRGEDTWGDHMGRWNTPETTPKKVPSHSIKVTQNQKSDAGQLPVRLNPPNVETRLKIKEENLIFIYSLNN